MHITLITVWSSVTSQHLHSFKYTLVNNSHSQHFQAAVCCVGLYFMYTFQWESSLHIQFYYIHLLPFIFLPNLVDTMSQHQ